MGLHALLCPTAFHRSARHVKQKEAGYLEVTVRPPGWEWQQGGPKGNLQQRKTKWINFICGRLLEKHQEPHTLVSSHGTLKHDCIYCLLFSLLLVVNSGGI